MRAIDFNLATKSSRGAFQHSFMVAGMNCELVEMALLGISLQRYVDRFCRRELLYRQRRVARLGTRQRHLYFDVVGRNHLPACLGGLVMLILDR